MNTLLYISWHLWNLLVYVIKRVTNFAFERFLYFSSWFQIRRSNRLFVELYEVFCHSGLLLLRYERILHNGLERNLAFNLLNLLVILREFMTQFLSFWGISHHIKRCDKGLRFGLMRIWCKILLLLLLISDNFLGWTFHRLPWGSLIRTILCQIRVCKRRL